MKRVSDVLNIIADKGFDWVKQNKAADLNIKRKRGTRVHSFIECLLETKKKKKKTDIPKKQRQLWEKLYPEAYKIFLKFEEWINKNVEKIISFEERIECNDLEISGRIDLIGKLKGIDGICVIDWKATAALNKKVELQTAAYMYLANTKKYKAEHRIAVRVTLDKHGEYDMQVKEYKKYTKHIKLFKMANEIIRWRHPNSFKGPIKE